MALERKRPMAGSGWSVQDARNYFLMPSYRPWRDAPNGAVGRVLIAEIDRLIARVEELEARTAIVDAAWETLVDDAEWECDCKVCAEIRALSRTGGQPILSALPLSWR